MALNCCVTSVLFATDPKKTGTSACDKVVPKESKGYFEVNTLCPERQDMRTVALSLSEAAFGR